MSITGGTFSVDCLISDVASSTNDCGVQKTLTWSNAGTKSNIQSYFFNYNLLNNKIPVYVFIKPKVKKLRIVKPKKNLVIVEDDAKMGSKG